jgi:hypothetical protein
VRKEKAMTGVELIAKERQRQIEKEHWTAEHDDEHTDGSLALAAVCYATPVQLFEDRGEEEGIAPGHYFVDPWPESWDTTWDKRYEYGDHSDDDDEDPRLPDPASYSEQQRVDLLVKAGALIAAEIDRLQRIRAARIEPLLRAETPSD